MKIRTTISLLLAAGLPLVTSAAAALPLSTSLRDTAAAPIQMVKHRQSRPHHRVAPAAQDDNDSYDAYNHSGGAGVDDWSHWSPSHHPGWPCIAPGGSDGSETSAYPAWEMKPQCQ
jgi:hypothetical protein